MNIVDERVDELSMELASANYAIDTLLFLLDDVGVESSFVEFHPKLDETRRELALTMMRMYQEKGCDER